MLDQPVENEWAGAKGKFNAWFFTTYTRKFSEQIIFGNYWPEFYQELEKRVSAGPLEVLDVGAGSGNFSIPIAKKIQGGHVYCLDSSKEMCDYLTKRSRKKKIGHIIRPINKDLFNSGLEDESIDWVVTGNVMHEISNPLEALKEMYRLLRVDGHIFIEDFRNWHGYHDGDAHGPYSVEQLTELLEQANFKDINIKEKRHFVVATAKKY